MPFPNLCFFCFKFPLTWTVFEFLGRLKLSRVNFMCRILNFNGWGSHLNRLFLVNGRQMRSNGWHKLLVNGKPFENGKSLVHVFPSKVTNIKSLIMAVITKRFGCITLLHCMRKPCLHWMFIVVCAYASYTFVLIVKLTLVKIICICACYLHKFTIWRAEDIARSARVWQAVLKKRGIRN